MSPFFQNVPSTVHFATMKQNAMNVPKDISLLKQWNVKVSSFGICAQALLLEHNFRT